MPRTALILAALLTASPALAGPPWISVEIPANQIDPETRGAFLTVRTYHHATPRGLVMRGTAEGLVGGRRRSVPLSYRSTRQTGVHALERSWDTAGVWVLDIRAADGHFEISALVGVGSNGEASFVRVPLARTGAPRAASRGEVETLLASLASGQAPPPLRVAGFGPDGGKVYAIMAGLGLLLAGVFSLLARLVVTRR